MPNDNEIEITTDENGLATDPAQLRLMLHDIACRSYDIIMHPALGLFIPEDDLVSFVVALTQAHNYSCPHKNEHGDEEHPEPTTPPDYPAKATYHPFDPSMN